MKFDNNFLIWFIVEPLFFPRNPQRCTNHIIISNFSAAKFRTVVEDYIVANFQCSEISFLCDTQLFKTSSSNILCKLIKFALKLCKNTKKGDNKSPFPYLKTCIKQRWMQIYQENWHSISAESLICFNKHKHFNFKNYECKNKSSDSKDVSKILKFWFVYISDVSKNTPLELCTSF